MGPEQRGHDADPWDYVHITCWNFLPFLLRRVGEAPAWAVRFAFVVWGTGLAALAATLLRLRKIAGQLAERWQPSDKQAWGKSG